MIATTLDLLGVGFVQSALLAAALLGVVSGVVAPLVVMRRMSFTVHGTSELALMGASAALLFGFHVGAGAVAGSVLAAVVLALLGGRGRDDAVVGVVLGFGLGLSVLFIHLYPGRTSTAFALLTGQIVGLTSASVQLLALVAVAVVATVALLRRPLLFASADPAMAEACGVPVRAIAVVFAVLVGLTAAQGVQIVGALLITSLLITPGAAAVRVTSSPTRALVLSVVFAELAAVGGVLLSLAPGVPVSVFVTAISFAIYLVCRAVAAVRDRRLEAAPAAADAAAGAAGRTAPQRDRGGRGRIRVAERIRPRPWRPARGRPHDP